MGILKTGMKNPQKDDCSMQRILRTDDVIKVFSKYNILTERELRSKIETKLENYLKTKEIEYKNYKHSSASRNS
jgi:glutamine synthetase type III